MWLSVCLYIIYFLARFLSVILPSVFLFIILQLYYYYVYYLVHSLIVSKHKNLLNKVIIYIHSLPRTINLRSATLQNIQVVIWSY